MLFMALYIWKLLGEGVEGVVCDGEKGDSIFSYRIRFIISHLNDFMPVKGHKEFMDSACGPRDLGSNLCSDN